MSDRRCRHFACPKDLLDRFQHVGSLQSDEAIQKTMDLLEADLPGAGAAVWHTLGRTWEDIHRLLTGDRTETELDLDFGECPLRLAIGGGKRLNPEWPFLDVISVVHADELPGLCLALEEAKEAWVRHQLLSLVGNVKLSTGWGMTDEDRSRVWGDFCSLRRFFREAERVGMPVVVVVEY